jgi:hypothetical protein
MLLLLTTAHSGAGALESAISLGKWLATLLNA